MPRAIVMTASSIERGGSSRCGGGGALHSGVASSSPQSPPPTSSSSSNVDHFGNCLSHPQIRIRRQNATTGEWRVILPSGCPLCAASEVMVPLVVKPRQRLSHRPTSSRSISSYNHTNSQESCESPDSSYKSLAHEFSTCSFISSSTDTTVACSDGSSVRSGGTELSHQNSASSVASSGGTASMGTSGAYGNSPLHHQSSGTREKFKLPLSSSRPPSSSSQLSNSGATISPMSTTGKKSITCGLRYTNPDTNQRGSYTGQLHPVSQLPHGIGALRYRDGTVVDGEWRDGKLVVEAPRPESERRERRRASLSSHEEEKMTYHHVRSSSSRHQESSCSALIPYTPHQYQGQEDDDANSINDDNSLGSNGDNTYATMTYSARESKGSLPPLAKRGDDRRSNHADERAPTTSMCKRRERRVTICGNADVRDAVRSVPATPVGMYESSPLMSPLSTGSCVSPLVSRKMYQEQQLGAQSRRSYMEVKR